MNAKCLRALINFSLSRQLFQRLWTSVGPINIPICVPPTYTFIHPNAIGLSTDSSPFYPSNQLSIYPPTHISTYSFTHTYTHLIFHCASETQTLGSKPGARVAPQPRSWLLHTQSLPLAFLSHTQLLLACPRPLCGALKTVCTGGCGTLPLPACPGHGSVGGGAGAGTQLWVIRCVRQVRACTEPQNVPIGMQQRQQDLRLLLPLLRHQVYPGGHQEGPQTAPGLHWALQM